MNACPDCGNGVERRFRFCPWCATPLRSKFVEFFAPHPDVDEDREKALRVSRYLGSHEQPPQVRFSIWNVDQAEAAVSVTNDEAARLAAFVAPMPTPPPVRTSVLEQLRQTLRV